MDKMTTEEWKLFRWLWNGALKSYTWSTQKELGLAKIDIKLQQLEPDA